MEKNCDKLGVRGGKIHILKGKQFSDNILDKIKSRSFEIPYGLAPGIKQVLILCWIQFYHFPMERKEENSLSLWGGQQTDVSQLSH